MYLIEMKGSDGGVCYLGPQGQRLKLNEHETTGDIPNWFKYNKPMDACAVLKSQRESIRYAAPEMYDGTVEYVENLRKRLDAAVIVIDRS